MRERLQHYIDGKWVDSEGGARREVINPATEEPCCVISVGTAADVDKAVKAARRAFKTYSQTTREERLALLNRIVEEYKKRAAIQEKREAAKAEAFAKRMAQQEAEEAAAAARAAAPATLNKAK